MSLAGTMGYIATRTVARTAHSALSQSSVQMSARISRPFHSTIRSTAQETIRPPAPARVPRPIPLDMGAGPATSIPVTPASTAAATSTSTGGRHRQGGFFYKYGSPIFTIAVFASASTLAMHILYHHLALEEYQLASTQKIKDLETEISLLKTQQQNHGQVVRHPPGGRGEFV